MGDFLHYKPLGRQPSFYTQFPVMVFATRLCHTITSMRYWWANQKTAYDAEVAGGYLWSRKRRANGSRNPFYESLRLTQPGDVIFGYQNSAIRAVGFVLGPATDAPCPQPAIPPRATEETVPDTTDGWLVPVSWLELQRPLFPAQYMPILQPLLPEFHAPLTATGRGIQGGRLMEIAARLAQALLELAGGRNPAQLLNPSWEPRQLRFDFPENPSPAAGKPASSPATDKPQS